MGDMTRRRFIGAAGAVTGAAAISAVGPHLVAQAAGIDPAALDAGELPKQTVLAYVKDPASGTVSVMVGQREVTVTDRALVRRIVNAAR
jgi:hypothetical protein